MYDNESVVSSKRRYTSMALVAYTRFVPEATGWSEKGSIVDNERMSIHKHFVCKYHVSLDWLEG